jgi:hypothetical protein
MPSLKRDRLLSDLERERLTKRETLDRHTRTTNDVRVKRKLSAWLKGFGDVFLCLHQLPKDQLQRILKDELVYLLLAMAIEIMKVKGFRPIVGDVMHPEEWKTENPVKWEVIRGGASSTVDIFYPITNVDIVRSEYLTSPISKLYKMLDLSNNPVVCAVQFQEAQNDPAIQKIVKDSPHVSETYKPALERIAVAKASIKEEESPH